MDWKEKVVLITGSGTGIGQAIAKKFAENGASVIILGRRREPLEETKKILEEIISKVQSNAFVKIFSGPHAAELCRDVDARSARRIGSLVRLLLVGPDAAFQPGHHCLREESARRAVHMPIAHPRLSGDVVLERRDQMEVVPRARHGDVEQAALLFDLIGPARREI